MQTTIKGAKLMKPAYLLPVFTAMVLLFSNAVSADATQGGQLRAEVSQPGSGPAAFEPISGKVAETMDSGGYTYILLKDGDNKTWVAVPSMKVKVGDEMAFQPGNKMMNFKSKTMDRTFDSIVFSPGTLALPGTKADRSAKKPSGPVAQKVEKVEKAKGANAQTVAGCYKDSAKLNGKQVAVHGKVVKVSKAIMGVNWVHVQDGTGDSIKGTHNLVFTTEDLPATGDTVTATGTLAKDKDFGYGYKYDVIVEKSRVTK
jgi:hypothetical protein